MALADTLTPTTDIGAATYSTVDWNSKSIRIYKDLAYGTRADQADEGANYVNKAGGKNSYHTHRSGQQYDLYLPASPISDAPVYLDVHGGSWSECFDKDGSEVEVMKSLAARGFVAIGMDYQLQSDIMSKGETTPRENATFADMLRDIDAMLQYLKDNEILQSLGASTNKIIIGGTSAGAHLSMMYAWDQTATNHSVALNHPLPIRAVVPVQGPSDFTDRSMMVMAAYFPYLEIEAFVAASPELQQMKAYVTLMGWLSNTTLTQENFATEMAKWSPALLINENSCPAILAYSTTNTVDDATAHQSSDGMIPVPLYDSLTNKLTAAGVDYRASLFTGIAHGYLAWSANLESNAGYQWLVTEIANYATNFVETVPVDYPEGKLVWIAKEPGKASVASNWSLNRVPTATDNILFDGNFSTVDCEWDADAVSTVASWTMQDGYTGRVTVDTMYPGGPGATFTKLSVTGDLLIDCGSLTQVSNDVQKEEYRLNIGVGGNLAIGASGKIDVTGRGPRGVMSGRTANVHAGDQNSAFKTYGDPKYPYACGSGNNGAWPSSYKGAGGGAIWIEVTGAATVNGKILSEGSLLNSNMGAFNGTAGNISTSGGSIYLKAASLTGDGTGVISAKSEFSCNQDNQIGSGGRVAVELTATPYDFDSAKVKIAANSNAKQAGSPGHGTVVIKNPGEENGTLYVIGKYDRTFSYNNCAHTCNQTTSIPAGDTWTFDKVVVGDFGMISVGPGATLSLPNGWQSVVSKNDTRQTSKLKRFACGIIYRGGTLDVPAKDGKHSFKNGNWTFHPTVGYALDADTEVSGGASLGTMYLSATNTTVLACDVKVAGNLDIKADGYMNANWGGLGGNATGSNGHYSPFINGTLAEGSGHGGQNALAMGNDAYGSFLNPVLPGTAAGHADFRYMGGGVIKLEVTGTLNVDGKIQSCSGWEDQTWKDRPPAPGSINIKAAALTGSGAIAADAAVGYVGAWVKTSWRTQGPAGGGRVAVLLTGNTSAFSDDWIARITAKGASATGTLKSDTTNTNVLYSSAGSVYLETASESAKKSGTIIVGNDGNQKNVAWTPFPAAAEAYTAEALKNVTLTLKDAGRVRFFDSILVHTLLIPLGTILDLNGQNVISKRARIGGKLLGSGRYLATDFADSSCIVDSAEMAGSLTIIGSGFTVRVR